jgi:hypothetical protein
MTTTFGETSKNYKLVITGIQFSDQFLCKIFIGTHSDYVKFASHNCKFRNVAMSVTFNVNTNLKQHLYERL